MGPPGCSGKNVFSTRLLPGTVMSKQQSCADHNQQQRPPLDEYLTKRWTQSYPEIFKLASEQDRDGPRQDSYGDDVLDPKAMVARSHLGSPFMASCLRTRD